MLGDFNIRLSIALELELPEAEQKEFIKGLWKNLEGSLKQDKDER